jgi:hypothetical protein
MLAHQCAVSPGLINQVSYRPLSNMAVTVQYSLLSVRYFNHGLVLDSAVAQRVLPFGGTLFIPMAAAGPSSPSVTVATHSRTRPNGVWGFWYFLLLKTNCSLVLLRLRRYVSEERLEVDLLERSRGHREEPEGSEKKRQILWPTSTLHQRHLWCGVGTL